MKSRTKLFEEFLWCSPCTSMRASIWPLSTTIFYWFLQGTWSRHAASIGKTNSCGPSQLGGQGSHVEAVSASCCSLSGGKCWDQITDRLWRTSKGRCTESFHFTMQYRKSLLDLLALNLSNALSFCCWKKTDSVYTVFVYYFFFNMRVKYAKMLQMRWNLCQNNLVRHLSVLVIWCFPGNPIFTSYDFIIPY